MKLVLNLLLELAVLLGLHFHLLDALFDHIHDASHDVRHLAFQHVDDGVVSKASVGSQHHEHVGILLTGDAEIGLGQLPPEVCHEVAPGLAEHGGESTQHLEAGSAEDGVCLVLLVLASVLVLHLHSALRHSDNGVSDYRDVVSGQCGVEVARDEDSLAARREVGRQRIDQAVLAIRRQLVADVCRDELLQKCLRGIASGSEEALEDNLVDELLAEVVSPAKQLAGAGHPLENEEAQEAEGRVETRGDPVGRPLEDHDLLGHLGDSRHSLDGTCGRANDSHAPVLLWVVLVAPLGSVKTQALEVVEARDVWVVGNVQSPEGGHHHIAKEALPRLRLDRPLVLVRVERGLVSLFAQSKVRIHVILAGAMLEVLEDLWLCRIHARPVVLRLEAVGIEVRGNVAGAAVVSVPVPRTAHLWSLLDDHEGDACLLQLDPKPKATEACSNDHNLELLR
mmetsp:Transcript_11051/g.45085  ORF Transcript_11051/g.45085 Transcript_11051/m.45085 type:complete len:452 (+) Transcript_11051:200-1555(+)